MNNSQSLRKESYFAFFSRIKFFIFVFFLTSIYAVAGKLGLMAAVEHPSASAVWPPTGIALAWLIIFGTRLWPVIFIGAFLVNVTTFGTITTSLGIAFGNTLEAVLGAYLIQRFAHGRQVFDRPQDVLKFVVLAGMISTAVSASVGVTTLTLKGLAPLENYGSIWLTWWLGDLAGAVSVTPFVIFWYVNPRFSWNFQRMIEWFFVCAALYLVGFVTFYGKWQSGLEDYLLTFLTIPIFVWAVFSFEQREITTVVISLATIMILGTMHNVGPFVRGSVNESLLLLQIFITIVSMTVLILTTAISKLRREEAEKRQLAAIVDSSSDGIIGMTEEGIITSWNKGAEAIYGYTAEEMIGKNVFLFTPKDRINEFNMILGRLRLDEPIQQFETIRLHKDGSKIHVSLSCSPIKDSKGRIIGVSKIVRDITGRVLAEQKFRLVVEAAPNAMIMVNQQGLIELANHQAELLFAYKREELIGKPVEMLVPKQFQKQHPGHRAQFHKDPSVRPMGGGRDLYGLKKSGEEIPVEIGLNPLETSDGLFILASIIDISERKKTEAIIQDKNRELETILYAASHDLSEPLRSMESFSSLLQESYNDRLDPKGQDFLNRVVRAAKRMRHLLDDILMLSRARSMKSAFEHVPSEDIVQEVFTLLETVIRNRNAKIRIVGKLPTIYVNRIWCIHALQNLISNAIKFTPPSQVPDIEISGYERAEKGLHEKGLVVKDRGFGVNPEHAERIFMLFQRAVSRDVEGTGAGLAIVREVANRHRGHAWVQPRDGGGSEFYLTFASEQNISKTKIHGGHA